MEIDDKLQFTPTGEEQFARLKSLVEYQLRQALYEENHVPGDTIVEITGSDVQQLSDGMRLTFRGQESRRAKLLMALMPSLFAAIAAMVAGGAILSGHPFDGASRMFERLFIAFSCGLSLVMIFLIWQHLLSNRRDLPAASRSVGDSKVEDQLANALSPVLTKIMREAIDAEREGRLVITKVEKG